MKIQLAALQKQKEFGKPRDQVREIANRLEDKQSIPMVRAQIELIQDLQQEEYRQDITLPMLEQVRKRLRDLVKFIDKSQRKIIYTDFEDAIGDEQEVTLSGLVSGTDLVQYRKKVMSFLRENDNHIALHKLKHNVPITPTDVQELERLLFESGKVGTREDFERSYGKQENLGLFIRSLIGLDREAAKRAFSDYLNEARFNSTQIQFINLIINYLAQNGLIEPKKLYEPPYTDYNPSGLDGVFQDADADNIVSILKSLRKNAAA